VACSVLSENAQCWTNSVLKIQLTHSLELGSVRERQLLLPQESIKLETPHPASDEYPH